MSCKVLFKTMISFHIHQNIDDRWEQLVCTSCKYLESLEKQQNSIQDGTDASKPLPLEVGHSQYSSGD
jgi:hypothetical protein